jgi:hypothetical protein
MLSALQVNIAGGRLPPPESDGRRYLKIPLNALPLVSSVRCSSAEAALTYDVGYQNRRHFPGLVHRVPRNAGKGPKF